MLVSVGAIIALAAPAAAAAKTIPAKHPATPIAKAKTHVTVTPRVLCICVVVPTNAVPDPMEQEVEQQTDADLIAAGLDPIYGTVTTPTAAAAPAPAG
jgi:hypothetical protein